MELLDFSKGKDLKSLEVIESNGKKKVFVKGQLYMSWGNEDKEMPKIAIAQLNEICKVKQKDLAKAFEVDVRTVYNYIESYKNSGVRNLIGYRSGPKESWKLLPEIRGKILVTALKPGKREYHEIQESLKRDWKEEVSIASIRQVLLENGFVKEKIEIPKLEQLEIFEHQEEGQLDLKLTNEIEEDEPEEREEKKDEKNIHQTNIETKKREMYSKTQREYLDQLEEGIYSVYGGGLLFAPLIERYKYLPTIKGVIEIESQNGYSIEEICLTLFYFDEFRFESMENFKTVYPEEFGILIGRPKSPSIFTLRRFLHKVRELEKSEELIYEFAEVYLREGITKWGVLYIDGHFVPYYGMYAIKMGMHGVIKKAMKGSYNFLAVDEEYMPLLFLLRSSSEDLLRKIPEIILKAKEIAGKLGINEKEEPLTVVFDREGYSAELFRMLSGMESEGYGGKYKVRFITWAKYSDRWVNNIKAEKFDKEMYVKYEIEKPKHMKYYETTKRMNKYGEIRAIVVERQKDKKRMAIYTNAEDMKAERIVEIMCRRWGEENFIKELLWKHQIDYTPGYVIDELEEQPLVENPKLKELKQKILKLKSKLTQTKTQFGSNVLEDIKNEASNEEIKKKHKVIMEEMTLIRAQITLLEEEKLKLPETVSFDEAHNGKKRFELNYEKKRFLDCLKVFTYNMEKKMCEILFNYYPIKKELYPALAMIIRRGAHIKLENGKLKVRLRRFQNREIDYAARHLCEDLNKMKPVTLDKFQFPIYYEGE